jgi:hypothetical protein
MAISGQETLQIGAQNSPTNSDSLWVAFNKTQNNFSTLFSEASPYNIFTSQAGIGVTSNASTGTVTITNTGVLNLIQGTGITLSGANGNIVVSATGGNGTSGVTSVGISSNSLSITNTPVVSSGVINVDLPVQTNILAGNYIAPTVTIDQYGRITNIANASSFGTVTSVAVSGGTGISVSGGPITTNGTITLTNTGVTRLTAGSGIVLTNNTGNITITATAAGGGGSANAAGNTGEIQFNLTGTFSSSANLKYDSSNNILRVGNLESTGDLLPSANITYDLGSPTKRWKDLYLSNNSIILGESTLSIDNGALTVNGNPPDAVFESLEFGEGSGVDWMQWSGANLTVAGPDANILSTLQKVGVGMKITLLTPPAVAGNVLTTASRLELTSNAIPDHYQYTFTVLESAANSQYVYSADIAYTNTLSLASDGNIVLPGSDSSITYIDGTLAAPQIIGEPANATANGIAGQIAFSANYLYVCTAANTWKRANISTW